MDDNKKVDNLEENFAKLLEKMVSLDGHKTRVTRRHNLRGMHVNGWLIKVEDRKCLVKEIESKFFELKRHGFDESNFNARHELNMEVIENIVAVDVLIEASYTSPESIHAFLSDLTLAEPRAFSRENLQIFTLKFSEKISSDKFGDVYKGHFHHGKKLMVKVLAEKPGVLEETIFMAGVRTLGKASHRNVVKFYGYCFEPMFKALVYEYMENESFDKILYQNSGNLEWETFYRIAVELAKGLAYLHDGCDEQIIHLDVKAANVLIHHKFSPKIAGFGIARLIKKGRSILTGERIRGTPGYLAPEMCLLSSRITSASDVYSFGILLFEVLGMREINQSGQVWFPQQVWKEFENGQLDNIIEKCGIKKKDKKRARVLAMVAFWCIQGRPQLRPSMSTVVKLLEMEIPVKIPPHPFAQSSTAKGSSGTSLNMKTNMADLVASGAEEKNKGKSDDAMSMIEMLIGKTTKERYRQEAETRQGLDVYSFHVQNLIARNKLNIELEKEIPPVASKVGPSIDERKGSQEKRDEDSSQKESASSSHKNDPDETSTSKKRRRYSLFKK